jgi:hypothetical protein
VAIKDTKDLKRVQKEKGYSQKVSNKIAKNV